MLFFSIKKKSTTKFFAFLQYIDLKGFQLITYDHEFTNMPTAHL